MSATISHRQVETFSLDQLQGELHAAAAMKAVTGTDQESNAGDVEPKANGVPVGYDDALESDAPSVLFAATGQTLGPFNCDIRFGDGIPVGGWSQLTFHDNGSWNFSGHLHDSGAPSYNSVVTWGVQSVRTGDVYVLRHTGHMAGTFEPGSRNDDWGDNGTNPALAAGWHDLAPAWRWNCRAYVNWDLNGAISQLLQIIAAGQAIGRVITLI